MGLELKRSPSAKWMGFSPYYRYGFSAHGKLVKKSLYWPSALPMPKSGGKKIPFEGKKIQ